MARASASQRDRAAEGSVWPVVAALVMSTLLGTVVGWWLLSRGSDSKSSVKALSKGLEQQRDASPSPPSLDSEARQQLLNRLRALQIDRTWFLRLVDSSWLRGGVVCEAIVRVGVPFTSKGEAKFSGVGRG